MDEFTAWSMGVVATAIGVLLGFALNGIRAMMVTQYETRGHLLALRTDIIRCGGGARGYVTGGVMVPAGRLPIRSYTTSFPVLLMKDLLTEQEVDALSRFFDNADSFNRSLDYAQEAIANNRDNLDREVKRAHMKARKVVPGIPDARTQYDEALEIMNRHLAKKSGHRLLWWKG